MSRAIGGTYDPLDQRGVAPQAAGGAGYPPAATALFLQGANPALKPERAASWATSVTIHPDFAPSAELEIGWFDIRYRHRIVTPIIYSSQSLASAAYADRVNLNPSQADIAAAIAGREFDNYTDGAYDPDSVVAIVNDDYANAANQHIRGIDASGRYKIDLSSGSLSFSGNVTYLKSDQKLTDLQPRTALAGTLFNPPHVRGRGGVVFDTPAVTAAAYVNFTDGVKDTLVAVRHIADLDPVRHEARAARGALLEEEDIDDDVCAGIRATSRQASW